MGTAEAVQTPGMPSRRKIFRMAAAGAAGLVGGMALSARVAHAEEASSAPRVAIGDRLVEDDAEGPLTPLKVEDLTVGRPLLAFALNAETGKPRTESRLNKIVLLRLPEAELDAESKALSAGGVLAFSAICTHQGCEIKTWMKSEKVFACFCHSSKFNPTKRGAVAGGPAPRSLPALPLRLEGDQLVVAGEFSSPPGSMLQG
ncbi:MAG: Rieske (2Fe-2S) protein [Rhodocyclaceae bacterium]|nr:Rieske (2Fe-2S) protein [Rhodocyclaceae bacterium]